MNEEDKKRRERLRDGLIEAVEFYLYTTNDGHRLCESQLEHLKEVRDRLYFLGEIGSKWATLANEIVNEQIQIQANERY